MIKGNLTRNTLREQSVSECRGKNHRHLFHALQTGILAFILITLFAMWYYPAKVGAKVAEFKAAYDSVLIVHNKFYSAPEK